MNNFSSFPDYRLPGNSLNLSAERYRREALSGRLILTLPSLATFSSTSQDLRAYSKVKVNGDHENISSDGFLQLSFVFGF